MEVRTGPHTLVYLLGKSNLSGVSFSNFIRTKSANPPTTTTGRVKSAEKEKTNSITLTVS